MSQPLCCSLIIAVYNQAPQLALVLETVGNQTKREFEIIVADDGSSDDVEPCLGAFRERHADIPVRHVWHEDRGFRKTIAVNEAVRRCNSDYLVFVDGDMLLHPRFIENHLRHRDRRRVLAGYRGVKLRMSYAQALIARSQTFNPSMRMLFAKAVRGQVARPVRGLVLHNAFLRAILLPRRENLSGCNFSLYAEALREVNGMDESIREYGYEDFELGQRLKRAGYKIFNVSKLCNTYHLDHPKNESGDVKDIKQRIRGLKSTACRHGLVELTEGSSREDFGAPASAAIRR